MKFIIPILVGSIIGYITNWFAIKMLFRPQREIKLLGFHLPFTPGLIPKEKHRIAKSIGEAVGTYLLTPETFTKTLLNDKTDQQIEMLVKGFIDKINESDKSIKTSLSETLAIDIDQLLIEVSKRLTEFIHLQLKEKRFKDEFMRVVEHKVYDKYDEYIYAAVKEKTGKLICSFSTSEEIKMWLETYLDNILNSLEDDDRTLGEIIPNSLVKYIKEYLNDHGNEIMIKIKAIIENPSVKRKIKSSISEIVSQNTNKFIAVFLPPELVAEKVLAALDKYIDNPDNNKVVITIGLTLIDKLMQGKVSDIISGISIEKRNQSVLQISNIIINYISNEKNQETFIELIGDRLEDFKPKIKVNILNLISEKFDEVIELPLLYEKLNFVIQGLIENIMDKPLSLIVGTFDDATTTDIINFTRKTFRSLVNNKLPGIIAQLNLAEVVETQIDSFDVDYTEKIIIGIASKELKAITWLGALLGGVMGLTMPFLQLLYK